MISKKLILTYLCNLIILNICSCDDLTSWTLQNFSYPVETWAHSCTLNDNDGLLWCAFAFSTPRYLYLFNGSAFTTVTDLDSSSDYKVLSKVKKI